MPFASCGGCQDRVMDVAVIPSATIAIGAEGTREIQTMVSHKIMHDETHVIMKWACFFIILIHSTWT